MVCIKLILIKEKNKKYKAIIVAIFALIAGYGVCASQQETEMSELALANVEALAQSESGGGYTKYTGQCPDPISYKRWVSCEKGGTEECYPSDC